MRVQIALEKHEPSVECRAGELVGTDIRRVIRLRSQITGRRGGFTGNGILATYTRPDSFIARDEAIFNILERGYIGIVDCLGQIVPGVPPLVSSRRVWKKEIPFFLNHNVEGNAKMVEE
jgi:hypothetical protein